MPRISFAGFRDPVKRPRYIIWVGVAVLVLAAFVIVALGVTSTRWFCAEGCHKVQDDAITAYRHSTHSEVSCMACHMPVGADPVTFVLHKAEALGELYLTVTNNFELPLNGESEVALTMKSTQCTQCHDLKKRPVTPSKGILIDHEAHAEAGVSCTICHNRIAHDEDFSLKLKDPKTGKANRKHEQFMTMTACFRCHSQKAGAEGTSAPGRCSACHPKGFELKPESHREEGFYPSGHAKLAQAEETRVAGIEKSEPAEGEADGAAAEESVGLAIPKVETLNECSTCHAESFCTNCHGIEMPHPSTFKKDHGVTGKKNPKVCSRCHGDAKRFCDECHHGSSMGWEFSLAKPWRYQHPAAVADLGASTCFECHQPTYCAHCHVSGSAD